MLAAEKHKATFIAPIGIGLVLFVCQLLGTLWTGCGMNPARAFGPSVTSAKFHPYHWIYWVGPYLGAVIAVSFYTLLKAFDYGSVVLGQDSDDTMASPAPVPVYSRMWQASQGFTHGQRDALIQTGMAKDQVDMAEMGMVNQAQDKLANCSCTSPIAAIVSGGTSDNGVPSPFISAAEDMLPMTTSEGQDLGGMASPHTHGGWVYFFLSAINTIY